MELKKQLSTNKKYNKLNRTHTDKKLFSSIKKHKQDKFAIKKLKKKNGEN